jgi:hypothetical protein
MGALFSTVPDPHICRTLLYFAFVVGLWALVIGIIYLVNFQNSEERGLWLSHVCGPITTIQLVHIFPFNRSTEPEKYLPTSWHSRLCGPPGRWFS